MKRLYNRLRLNVNVGLGVAFAVLLGVGVLSVVVSTAAGRVAQRGEASYARRVELLRLLNNMRTAEAAQRGLFITDRPEFQGEYERTRRLLAIQIQRTAAAFAGDTIDHPDMERIEGLLIRKVAFMDSAVARYEHAGRAAAQALVATGIGAALADSAQELIARLGMSERREIAAVEDNWRRAQRRNVGMAVLASALTMVFLILGAFIINRDITRRLHAETMLRESEHRLFQLLEAIPVGLIVVDVRRQSLYFANRASQAILGVDVMRVPVERLATELQTMVAGTDQLYPPDRTPLRRAIQGEEVHADDIEVHRGGRRIPIESWASPIYDEHGELLYAVAAFHEISERREAEAALRELTAELSDFYENAPYGYHSIDREGRFVRVNRTMTEWLGYTKDELLAPMHINDVLTPASRDAFTRDFPRVKLTGMVISRDYEMLRRDGTSFPVMISATAVRADDGTFVRTRTSVVDLTERRRAEAAERKAREAAEAANQAKSAFLARMSHELRTPLNSIIGFSEVLEDQSVGPLNGKQARYVHNVLTSGRQLLELVNDVLDLSRIEAGRMDLVTAPMIVRQSLEHVRSELEPLAAAKQLSLTLSVAPDVGTIVADESRFRQIVRNLVANAIKYTPEGGTVDVGARAVAGPTGQNDWIEVAVSDTGIGIRPEDQARIFGEFEQVVTPYVQEQTGTGLGLAVVRRLVEMHSGRIQLDSTPNQGSVFRVRLPARGPNWRQSLRPTAKTPGRPAPLVLVVDDEPAGADLLTNRLQTAGYRVAVANSGESAVALARQLGPDLIALDILLPQRDGLGALARLKSEAATRDIPVVVLSKTPDGSSGFSLGAAAWFVRPVVREDLIRAARRAVPRDDGRPRSALVAETDPAARQLEGHYLEEDGFSVTRVASGREAISGARELRPDLIVLDLLLPDRNGFDVVGALRSSPETRDIPVILCLEPDLPPRLQEQLRATMRSLLHKEGVREQLLREVQRLSDMERGAPW